MVSTPARTRDERCTDPARAARRRRDATCSAGLQAWPPYLPCALHSSKVLPRRRPTDNEEASHRVGGVWADPPAYRTTECAEPAHGRLAGRRFAHGSHRRARHVSWVSWEGND